MRIAMALLLTTVLAEGARAAAERACDYGAPHPQAPPETRQFAFLIGDFEVSLSAWQGEGWSPPRQVGARWNGRYGLNGMVIVDEWFDPSPEQTDGVWGVNVRTFDPQARQWKMMWISLPERQVQDLRAEVQDGTLTMWQVYPERPGWRAEFEVAGDGHWARISYVRDGADGEWTPQYRLAATPVPCG